MVFFGILEPILAILIIAVLVSQCAVPAMLSRPWFPAFRRGWKVLGKISRAQEDIEADALEQKLNDLKGDVNGVRKQLDEPDSSQRP